MGWVYILAAIAFSRYTWSWSYCSISIGPSLFQYASFSSRLVSFSRIYFSYPIKCRSFGFIAWNNFELHQARMVLILLSTDFTILWVSLKFILFAIVSEPWWYRAKDSYNTCSIIKEVIVGSLKLNFLNVSAFFLSCFWFSQSCSMWALLIGIGYWF